MTETVQNLHQIRSTGTRSFAQINYVNGKLHLHAQNFADFGVQLPEEVFEAFSLDAYALALLHPAWTVSNVRYDLEPSIVHH